MTVRTPPVRNGPESILRRDPREKRRSFLARAMALEPIGDIADVALTSGGATTTLTWETATDWDNAVSEAGVVHEATANTDHNDATVYKKGYPYGSFDLITPTPFAAYPLHEDSGSTAYDLAGTNDGTYNGPTLGGAGLLGTTAPSGDGTDDYVDFPIGDTTVGDRTFAFWFKTADTSQYDAYGDFGTAPNTLFRFNSGGTTGDIRYILKDGSDLGFDVTFTSSITYTDDVWHHFVAVADGTNDSAQIYLDGTQIDSGTATYNGTGIRSPQIFKADGLSSYLAGEMADLRLYKTALTQSQIQTLYDVVNTAGDLKTATKTFASAQSPDLVADVTLNGVASFDVDVIGSPAGTPETNTVTVDTDGENTYTVTWSSSHTDFRVRPKPAGVDNESTATGNKLELSA